MNRETISFPPLSPRLLERLKGAFIVVDGMNGSGKTTVSTLLVDVIRDARRRADPSCDNVTYPDWVAHFREPGGTAYGEKLRELLIAPGVGDVCPETQALMFMAARAQLVREKTHPLRRAGFTVVCDRWASTTFAYQGGGGGMDYIVIDDIYDAAVPDDLRPDLVLILDVPVESAVKRLQAADPTNNRWREMSESFYRNVRTGYAKWQDMYPAVTRVVDANARLQTVLDRVVEAAEEFFQPKEL